MAETVQSDPQGVRVASAPDFWCEFIPSPRRVRVEIAGTVIADTTRAMLYREAGRVPVYYFPKADLRMDLMRPSRHRTQCPHRGEATHYSLKLAGRVEENLLWAYEAAPGELSVMREFCAFQWKQVDHWYEEDDEIFVHARDPHKRVDVVWSKRPVRVVLAGETIAESENALFLFETNWMVRFYLPPDDVRMDLLRASETRTSCPYKGDAVYWSAEINGEIFEDVVWSYPEPIAECPRIKGYLCFYNERMDDIFVDGQAAARERTRLPWQ